jgi:hypothetical protein
MSNGSSTPGRTDDQPPLFAPKSTEARSFPVAIWGAAGLLVLLVVAGLILAGRHRSGTPANTALALDPYAANLPMTDVRMSESTSLSGGKSTFIDGKLRNSGQQTVTGVTVQVFFRNDMQLPPQIETMPLSLVRTHEPYVDTQPVSAAPLKPGDEREFRLIFETIPTNWNVQLPEIHVVRVANR